MGDGKWVKMVENGQKWVTIQRATSQMHRKLRKKTQYGTKNLSKGAKSEGYTCAP